ncbi:hypothetical protein JZ751_028194 [Albula glossodonta]|uniref:Nck-associated protein 5 C-terminal domain-containing protein n=1 Tax=Albula glossodonta TaxID=121402 RepID=A0A8T2PDD7_9TELE|nr:hypothetical protein JZ751_028194 [Albula glossodonta]
MVHLFLEFLLVLQAFPGIMAQQQEIRRSTLKLHLVFLGASNSSSCQMRTLDSGIGTFPLPDSVARATGRHLPKSASTPERALAMPTEPPQDPPPTLLPRWKVPSRPETGPRPHSGIGASLSDPTMKGSKDVPDPQSRLPKPSTSSGINPKKTTPSNHSLSPAQTTGPNNKQTEKRKSGRDHASPSERALHVCTYSGSSCSEADTEPEDDTSVKHHTHETPPSKSKTGKSVNQEGMKRSSMGNRLSIMDLYQQEVLTHYEKEERRAVSKYNSSGTEGKVGDTQSESDVNFGGSHQQSPRPELAPIHHPDTS